MKLSIASYSFHRTLAAGNHDMFKYITDCKELGATQLEPWNGHLTPLKDAIKIWKAGADPDDIRFTQEEESYLDRVGRAAAAVGLPFGCLAVDGAHIYESAPAARRANRAAAHKWLEVAGKLAATQLRIDAGGPEDMPDDIFEIIVSGYQDLVARGRDRSVEIVIENHWGPSKVPENVIKILEAVDGLGLLFDTNNWAVGRQEEAWEMCAPYARAVHIKPFSFDGDGNDPSVDLAKAINTLVDAGYEGCWGVESAPTDGDEYGAIRKTFALIRRVLSE